MQTREEMVESEIWPPLERLLFLRRDVTRAVEGKGTEGERGGLASKSDVSLKYNI